MNINSIIATVIGSQLATLHELQTVYGLEDLWNMFEIQAVTQCNEAQAVKHV